ncbi:hypothetical protein A7J50_2214 [Pseudomonas antarctica]|uniref:Uncharacterized protein n=1 Tax=Pseudomonas antarctica TaxID=219572 RepID=A0A172YZA3_9PSED|nr:MULTISPECIES: hypothetical protein [Pseudomonas]ANF85623.1 hypothetical protein A7J50_2214 [Pseudomonas antarctica]MBX7276128.1 hypothetical protein [Pseudomonas sp. ERGC3:01]QZC93661.1 hypothetical protein K2E96_22740 [Pseudomonas sp. ERGC3:05]UXV21863.1 hypothetical protein N4P55_11070 [Pseudomonas fluorescens]
MSNDLARLEASLRLHTLRLKKLQRVWVPLQQCAPKWVMVLWIVGLCVTLGTQCYCHWLVTAPMICVLIVVEIIVEERQMTLILRADHARDLLRQAQLDGVY